MQGKYVVNILIIMLTRWIRCYYHFPNYRTRREHVEQGLKLECTASIGAVYWQSFQEKVLVVPKPEKSTSTKSWWGGSSGGSSSSFARLANVHLGIYRKSKFVLPLISETKIKVFFCISGSFVFNNLWLQLTLKLSSYVF